MLVCCPLFERPLLHHRLLVVMYIHTGLGGLSRSSPVEVVVAVIGSGGRGHRRLADASGTAGEGGELGECRCGATPTAVEERSVVPSAEARTIGIVFRPPPEESIDMAMFVEHGDEVVGELLLTLVAIRPCLRGIVGGAADGPSVGVSGLHHHDFFLWPACFQFGDRPVELTQRTMEIGVVAQSDDVIVDAVGAHLVEEVGQRLIFFVVVLL